jgi:hypothetical protein
MDPGFAKMTAGPVTVGFFRRSFAGVTGRE